MAMQSTPSTYDFDVFLSFRGSDTRFSFTGNLYRDLDARGFHTFRDDRELHGGEEITSTLFKAIENSRIAIIVFSKNYASSSFCLDELSHIMECAKKGCSVLPVFCKIDPSHVRHQTGSCSDALAELEEKFKSHNNNNYSERLLKWKTTLTEAANLSGYHHFSPGNGYEHEFIRKIVDVVSNTINRTLLHVVDYPIGLESRELKVKSLLKMGSNDGVCIMVGIHGIGGIGKTTLAKQVYNSIYNQFEVSCFLDAVSEKTRKLGLVYLQEILLRETVGEKDIKLGSLSKGISIIKQRLNKKKVLLILDDVDDLKQLQNLVGKPHWLGPGSRVIVTTQDTQLLASHGIETMYEVELLNDSEALELLKGKASISNNVDSSYEEILNRIVTYASGLPLALEVVGSIFSGKKHIEEMESLLSRYERIPHKDILKILQVSYDALGKEEQSVFLDIACCFKGYELSDVERILYAHYGECMECHIQVLVEKSLLKIDSWLVTSHDLIEAMGKEIVRQESPEDPGKRSRLWFHKDIVQVLEDNIGGSQIKIIHLDFPLSERKKEEIEWKGDELKNMENIKTLIIKNGRFSEAPEHIPSSLRVLEWHRYPSSHLPSEFWPKKLSICKLVESCLTSFTLAGSFKQLLNITEINLDDCQYLTHIHDVSGLPNLEIFSFDSCKNLITIHDSVGSELRKLKILIAQDCSQLKNFPPLKLPSLEELDLSGCNSLKSFPEILGEMPNIRCIDLDGTSIDELPLSFKNLTGVEQLEILGSAMFRFSSSIRMMPKLPDSDTFYCSPPMLKLNEDLSSMVFSTVRCIRMAYCKLPDEFFPIVTTWFTNLVELYISWCEFTVLPECLKECRFLETLVLHECKFLKEIIGIPPNLKKLITWDCYSLTSSCTRMLLNQELHENGGTKFYLQGTVRIPEWFEHQRIGPSISFWFRNKVPSIALYIVTSLLGREYIYSMRLNCDANMYINSGFEYSICSGIYLNRSYLFDLQLEPKHNEFDMKLENELLKNEWNHAEVRFQFYGDEIPIWRSLLIESGIHIWKHKNSMEDIQFTDPSL